MAKPRKKQLLPDRRDNVGVPQYVEPAVEEPSLSLEDAPTEEMREPQGSEEEQNRIRVATDTLSRNAGVLSREIQALLAVANERKLAKERLLELLSSINERAAQTREAFDAVVPEDMRAEGHGVMAVLKKEYAKLKKAVDAVPTEHIEVTERPQVEEMPMKRLQAERKFSRETDSLRTRLKALDTFAADKSASLADLKSTFQVIAEEAEAARARFRDVALRDGDSAPERRFRAFQMGLADVKRKIADREALENLESAATPEKKLERLYEEALRPNYWQSNVELEDRKKFLLEYTVQKTLSEDDLVSSYLNPSASGAFLANARQMVETAEEIMALQSKEFEEAAKAPTEEIPKGVDVTELPPATPPIFKRRSRRKSTAEPVAVDNVPAPETVPQSAPQAETVEVSALAPIPEENVPQVEKETPKSRGRRRSIFTTPPPVERVAAPEPKKEVVEELPEITELVPVTEGALEGKPVARKDRKGRKVKKMAVGWEPTEAEKLTAATASEKYVRQIEDDSWGATARRFWENVVSVGRAAGEREKQAEKHESRQGKMAVFVGAALHVAGVMRGVAVSPDMVKEMPTGTLTKGEQSLLERSILAMGTAVKDAVYEKEVAKILTDAIKARRTNLSRAYELVGAEFFRGKDYITSLVERRRGLIREDSDTRSKESTRQAIIEGFMSRMPSRGSVKTNLKKLALGAGLSLLSTDRMSEQDFHKEVGNILEAYEKKDEAPSVVLNLDTHGSEPLESAAMVEAPHHQVPELSPKEFDLAKVKGADGITYVLMRVIMENPERYGYTGEDVLGKEVFAKKLAIEAAANDRLLHTWLKESAVQDMSIIPVKGEDGKWHVGFFDTKTRSFLEEEEYRSHLEKELKKPVLAKT